MLGMLIKNWKYIVIALMALTIAVLTNRLVNSYKENGELSSRLDNEKQATTILRTQLTAANAAAQAQADREANAISTCEAAAEGSSSTAFQRGVLVGKVLGRKEQCETPTSSSAWPVSPSGPAPIKPPTPSSSTQVPARQTPVQPAR